MGVELIPFRVPLRTRFRGLTERVGLLLHRDNRWAEFSPFADYTVHQCARWLDAALEQLEGSWPQPVRRAVPVNVTIPAVAPTEAYELVRAAGCATAKVKVGDADGLERVEAVRDALGPEGNLRIDVNAAWDVDTAVRHLRALSRFDLEYAEQPVVTLDEMRRLRRSVDVPLAVDESLRTAERPEELDLRDAADVAVLKVSTLGGVRRVLTLAERLGLPAVVSSALETSVGLRAGIACAAALPELPYACGLGTAELLASDVTTRPLSPKGGAIEVREVAVDAGLIDGAVSDDESERLHRQLDAALSFLGVTL